MSKHVSYICRNCVVHLLPEYIPVQYSMLDNTKMGVYPYNVANIDLFSENQVLAPQDIRSLPLIAPYSIYLQAHKITYKR